MNNDRWRQKDIKVLCTITLHFLYNYKRVKEQMPLPRLKILGNFKQKFLTWSYPSMVRNHLTNSWMQLVIQINTTV